MAKRIGEFDSNNGNLLIETHTSTCFLSSSDAIYASHPSMVWGLSQRSSGSRRLTRASQQVKRKVCQWCYQGGELQHARSIGWWVHLVQTEVQTMNTELNQNQRPVILWMKRRDNPNDTHWVFIVSGSGSDPTDYLIHDPWFVGGAYMNLSSRARNYDFFMTLNRF